MCGDGGFGVLGMSMSLSNTVVNVYPTPFGVEIVMIVRVRNNVLRVFAKRDALPTLIAKIIVT